MKQAIASPLPVPPHFEPGKVEKVWQVPYQQRADEAREWRNKHRLQPAGSDSFKVALVLIDVQNTFCLPGFELYVGGRSGKGAIEDNTRLSRFIYENLHVLTTLVPTMDTHHTIQIFHPLFWVDEQGNHPLGAQTIITADEVRSGKWRPNPALRGNFSKHEEAGLQKFCQHYVDSLQEGGKFPLMIWPYHAMLGGIGHALVSSIEEAVFFHSVARGSQTRFFLKGEHPFTENYSVLAPEILTDEQGNPLAQRNTGLIDLLLTHDAVIIAGQAKSHCVAWTIEDLLVEIRKRDRTLANKIYLLEDATSPVVVPGVIDFTDSANQAYQRFSEAGMRLVKTTLPIREWPGVIGE